MNRRRVVITGLGAVTPLGFNIKDLWEGLLAGKSAGCLITKFDTTDYAGKVGAEVKGYEPEKYFSSKDLRYYDLSHQFALIAAREAVEDSGFRDKDYVPERAGSVVGTAHGGATQFCNQYEIMLKKGMRFISPLAVQMMFSDMAPGLIGIEHDLKGPNYGTAAACASGTIALGCAYTHIVKNEADIMVAGGADTSLHHFSMAGFVRQKAVSTRNDDPATASRPFDKDRDGFIVGEGAGLIVLEELEHARKRGAKIYAELAGYGSSCDAFHRNAPDPEGYGASLAINAALEDAGITPEQVDYINTHGTSTVLGDISETKAIKLSFKEHAYKVTNNSTKSMIGHMMGAAGAVEGIVTVLSAVNDVIHPTINFETPDPDCDLDYSHNRTTEKKINYAISNSMGFGGHNATICVKKFTG
ncbi:MAG: beta-ketoacyl-ACP synthase II [candidate division Zixibacteria bacterium]|nr:beta-ketoacyl-ACP synthase II [candidate division Zixibacteria bacterium]